MTTGCGFTIPIPIVYINIAKANGNYGNEPLPEGDWVYQANLNIVPIALHVRPIAIKQQLNIATISEWL